VLLFKEADRNILHSLLKVVTNDLPARI